MSPFLNKTELRKRWEISANTLEDWIRKGIIKPISPSVNSFSMAAIEAVERAGLTPEQLKPLEMARLRKENEWLRKAYSEMLSIIGQVNSLTLPCLHNVLPEQKTADAGMVPTYIGKKTVN